MIRIETQGTWRKMGRQYGEALQSNFTTLLKTFAPVLQGESSRWRPTVLDIFQQVEHHAPELIQETIGMADGLRCELELAMGFRLWTALAPLKDGCSLAYISDSDRGPLLARNGDMNPLKRDGQILRICRPEGGPATIQTTYVGHIAGHGMNEHGLGLVIAAAHTTRESSERAMYPALQNHLLLHHCRSVDDAISRASKTRINGRSSVVLLGDARGQSALLERPAGGDINCIRRRKGRDWQGATNFLLSGQFPPKKDQAYLQSAYARYGRLVHQLDENLAPRTVSGMQRLLADVAAGGPYCDGNGGRSVTGYSQILELRTGRMYFADGSPVERPFELVELFDEKQVADVASPTS